MPVARQRARAPDMFRPWVDVRERRGRLIFAVTPSGTCSGPGGPSLTLKPLDRRVRQLSATWSPRCGSHDGTSVIIQSRVTPPCWRRYSTFVPSGAGPRWKGTNTAAKLSRTSAPAAGAERSTMRAVVYQKPFEVAVEEVADPKIQAQIGRASCRERVSEQVADSTHETSAGRRTQ